MSDNLIHALPRIDSRELWLLLQARIGGVGEGDDPSLNSYRIHLPVAGKNCKVILTYDRRSHKITSVTRGHSFDEVEWAKIESEIDHGFRSPKTVVGREISFSSRRVSRWWKGTRSKIQILPPPNDAARAGQESAQHPFVLEFPISWSDVWAIRNFRRLQTHRRLTLLLNVLLNADVRFLARRPDHFWGAVDHNEFKWIGEHYFANIGESITNELSTPNGEPIEVLPTEKYYLLTGNDLKGLSVPDDLDDVIYVYLKLSMDQREKFDRAMYWMSMASRQWNMSQSASFASLVIAVEAMTKEKSGSSKQFKLFFEKYAAKSDTRSRNRIYEIRSNIVHEGKLMELDEAVDVEESRSQIDELLLHSELWALTRLALRNWLWKTGTTP